MTCIILVALVLFVIKILDLQRRISELEEHDPTKPHRSVLFKRQHKTGSDVYVMPDMSRKRA